MTHTKPFYYTSIYLASTEWSHSLAWFERPADNRKVLCSNHNGTTNPFDFSQLCLSLNGYVVAGRSANTVLSSDHVLWTVIERLPDLLTGSRVILSIVLLFLEPLSVPFLTIYLVACITDFLDGHLAREMGCKTPYGPYFDSLADCLLVAVVVYSIIVHVEFDNWMIIWIFIIASVRILAFIIGSVRYHKPAFIHSYLNKLTGMALFLLPFMLVTISTPVAVVIVCLLASVSSAEYLLMNILSDHYDPDCPSLLHL